MPIKRPARQRMLVGIMCFGLIALARPAFGIDGEDWVLVERFEAQLDQARDGDVEAMYEVGRMYERGRGTGRDLDRAVQWLTRAADAGHNAAQGRLGLMYLEGRGVAPDPARAHTLLSDAAKAALPSAQYHLGRMYEHGLGVERNRPLALKWYRAAAQGGYYRAKQRAAELSRLPPQAAPSGSQTRTKEPSAAESSRARADAAAPAAASRVRTAGALLELIQGGNWMNKDRPAGFLPSSRTRCDRTAGTSLKCYSLRQTRNTGFAVITYKTEAVISNFDSGDRFAVRYRHNVLNAEAVQANTATGIAEAQTTNPRVNVKLGRQAKEHRLRCELQNENTLVCTKQGLRTLTFSRR